MPTLAMGEGADRRGGLRGLYVYDTVEPLEIYLPHVLEQYSTPSPATVRCRVCGRQTDGGLVLNCTLGQDHRRWLPEIGGRVMIRCSSCGTSATIHGHFPGG